MTVSMRGGNVTTSDCHPSTEAFLRAKLRLNRLPKLQYKAWHWQSDDPQLGRFDLIIDSDLPCERDRPAQLAAFVQFRASPQAEVLIVDPDRGNRRDFQRCMEQLDFRMMATKIDEPLADRSSYRGRLLNCRRGTHV